MRMSFRSMPLWLLRAYLEECGGQSQGGGVVNGPGWVARLYEGEPYHLGSLTVGVTELELQGQPAALDSLLAQLEKKTIRGGG
jgi:hypothetical protein